MKSANDWSRWRALPVRRPLVVLLGAGILFEMCVLLGVLASPLVEGWVPNRASAAAVANPQAHALRWRQSQYLKGNDPRVGEAAPSLRLRTASGQPLDLRSLQGRKVAILFARDGSS